MSPSTLEAFIETYGRISRANQTVLSRFLVVAERLHEAGIKFILLKGADVITRLYGVHGSRPISDIDLLVYESDLRRIDHTLTQLGFVQQIDGNPSYACAELGLSLDLVTTLWYLDERQTAGLWARAITRRFPCMAIACLSTEDLLMHLTAYAVVHRGQLSAAFSHDLRLLIDKESPDWHVIVEQARQYGLAVPLHHGLAHVQRLFPAVFIPPGVTGRLLAANRREQLLAWFLRKVVTTDPLPQLGHLLLFLTQPPGKTLPWLYQTLFPSPAFLSYRYGEASRRAPWKIRLTRLYDLFISAVLLMSRVTRRVALEKPAA